MRAGNLSILLVLGAIAAGPTTAPSVNEAQVSALIAQLGHDDFKIREEASNKLAKIGKPALSRLKEAMSNGDPEVQSRAEMLIKRIEQRPVPGGPVNPDEPVVARSLRISNNGGAKNVEVRENQRTITIREDGSGGISMTVSAIENGRRVSEEFKAKNSDDLKKQSPDAFTLYERWSGSNGNNPLVRGAENLVLQGPILVGGLQALPVPLAQDPIEELKERIVGQMEQANVGDEKRKEISDLLDRVQKGRLANQIGAADERGKQLKDYFAASDELREKLAALKLPDPGDDLPPPSKWRLGIQIARDPEKLVVGSIVPESRAEKLGLQVGDVIDKIDDKPVKEIEGLREALSAAKGPIEMLVVRDGKEMKLQEKNESKPR
jgi:gas vesicle protein